MLYSIGMRVGIIAQEMSLWDRDAPSSVPQVLTGVGAGGGAARGRK